MVATTRSARVWRQVRWRKSAANGTITKDEAGWQSRLGRVFLKGL
jgi:hypothetical protein